MNRLLLFFLTVSFLSCVDVQEKATLQFDTIAEFPQNLIITQFTSDFVHQTDTFRLEQKEDCTITLEVDRPKYLYVLFHDSKASFYIRPGAQLKISQTGDRYTFEGDVKRENDFIQQIRDNPELKNKVWDYSAPLNNFKGQVADYFDYKKKLLSEYFPEKDKNFFYRLNLIDDRAMKNSVILQQINKSVEYPDKDHMFFESLDTGLFDFKEMKPYLDAGNLRSFYGRIGAEYFMKKKYGDNLKDLRIEEKYLLRGEVISEAFPQPFRSVLIYDDLKYYPLEYDQIPDSMNLPSPAEILARHKENLSTNAYEFLMNELAKWEKAKFAYENGTSMPAFDLKNHLNKPYKLMAKTYEKPILIDVWASWCGPCIRSFPKTAALQRKYQDNLQVISVSVDNSFDLFEEGLKEHEVPGEPQLYADKGFSSEFAGFFQIKGIPRYILIGEDGKIIDGNINLSDVEDVIQTVN